MIDYMCTIVQVLTSKVGILVLKQPYLVSIGNLEAHGRNEHGGEVFVTSGDLVVLHEGQVDLLEAVGSRVRGRDEGLLLQPAVVEQPRELLRRLDLAGNIGAEDDGEISRTCLTWDRLSRGQGLKVDRHESGEVALLGGPGTGGERRPGAASNFNEWRALLQDITFLIFNGRRNNNFSTYYLHFIRKYARTITIRVPLRGQALAGSLCLVVSLARAGFVLACVVVHGDGVDDVVAVVGGGGGCDGHVVLSE